jgi:hypothetical protein
MKSQAGRTSRPPLGWAMVRGAHPTLDSVPAAAISSWCVGRTKDFSGQPWAKNQGWADGDLRVGCPPRTMPFPRKGRGRRFHIVTGLWRFLLYNLCIGGLAGRVGSARPRRRGRPVVASHDSMSAKSLAKYPEGSILKNILHARGAAGARPSAPRWRRRPGMETDA